ncbi:MAG: hypothetical protein ACF8R7_13710 [Phycisphaerales bacterium JB039]
MAQEQEFGPGDIFLVPQSDGLWTIGQVLERPMAAASCLLSEQRIERDGVAGVDLDRALCASACLSALWATPEHLKSGRWPVVGRHKILLRRRQWANERQRRKRWEGATTRGGALVEAFLEAYYGLEYWDKWYDPEYLDQYLFPGRARPPGVKLGAANPHRGRPAPVMREPPTPSSEGADTPE